MTSPVPAPQPQQPQILRTYAYVDGFNLYYRALKGTTHKWLNLRVLLEALLDAQNRLDVIRYYTADVSGKLDPGAPKRQTAYLRAIRTIPGLMVKKGKFYVQEKWAPLHDPPPHLFRPTPAMVRIVRTDEKGSDVNLASHLLQDTYLDRFDVAVVLTNDSDLTEPIRIVKEDIGKPVGLICPAAVPAASLKKVATFVRHLTSARLQAAQFPPVVAGPKGPIMRPPKWKP